MSWAGGYQLLAIKADVNAEVDVGDMDFQTTVAQKVEVAFGNWNTENMVDSPGQGAVENIMTVAV